MVINGIDDLCELFLEAAKTERKMPQAFDLRAKGCWPEVAADPTLAYGYNDATISPSPANSAEVTRYDQALKLTMLMDEPDRKLVWAVAHSAARRSRGPAWARLGRMQGLHPQTVKRRFEKALIELWYKI